MGQGSPSSPLRGFMGSLAVLNPIRAGRTQQVGRSRSVSGETLHLRPGELEGGGINRCCFQGRA